MHNTDKTKKIDIVIPTYNGAKHLPRLLESISHQTYAGYECFVIDDNSKDNTARIIRERFPWVSLIVQAHNSGPSKNRNIAIRAGHSPYIVIFDDDTYIEDREWLTKALDKMEKNPEIGQLASMIVSGFDKNILLDCGIYGEGCLFGGNYYNQHRSTVSGKHEISRRVLGACTAGTILRRDLFERVGGFDPKYFYPAEDLELSLRIHLTGYDVIYDPSLVTYHFESQAMGKSIKRKMYMYRRNCLLALIENYPASHIMKTLRSLVCRLLNFPFVSSIFPAAGTKERLDFPQETRDYIKTFCFLAANSFGIMNKRRKIDRFKTRPRSYLVEINRMSAKEIRTRSRAYLCGHFNLDRKLDIVS